LSSGSEGWDITSDVGLTALAVTAARAVETNRADGLVRDPYAVSFVRAAEPPVPLPTRPDEPAVTSPYWRDTIPYIAVRSRSFDEYLAAAVADGIRQVVLVAAGLDARAYRLGWPGGTDLYEVDQPKVLEFKQRVLDADGAEPRCRRHPVPADLRDDWASALLDAGFDPSLPTAWLVEGLLSYLAPDTEEALFEHAHELSAPGSRFGAELISPESAAAAFDKDVFNDMQRSLGVTVKRLWNTADRRDGAAWLSSAGWDVSVESGATAALRNGREHEGRLDVMAVGDFLTARRPAEAANRPR
jgi:methyltransferase (TIGR00027 family)